MTSEDYCGEPWRLDAACQEFPIEMFFVDRGGSTRAAKSVCAGCSVQAECLDSAMRAEAELGPTHRHGVYGGLAPHERQRLYLRRRIPDTSAKDNDQ